MQRGYDEETISEIVKAKVTGNPTYGLIPLRIAYQTEKGEEGVIKDVLNAYLFSRREKQEEERVMALCLGRDIGQDGMSTLLLPDKYHHALVGLPTKNLAQELRVGVWRKYFGLAGADFSQPPPVTLINHFSQEKVDFYYALTPLHEKEPKAYVVLTFDERYGNSLVNVCTPEFMKTELENAHNRERVLKEFGNFESYTAQLAEKMSVQEYLNRRTNGFRFTKHVA